MTNFTSMDEYVKILTIAIPVFMLLIGIEWLISYWKGKKYLRSIDVVSSLSSGLTNTLKDVLGLTLVIISYQWFVEHIAITNITVNGWTYLIVFILKDFAQYWSHRWEHKINIFWNRHIVHHSSEDYNLACALRQPISNMAEIFIFLYIPMALLGIPTIVVATVAPLHLFAQFWYHTRLINKMGFLEHIIVTPSTHRVHHAINDIYLDKNFSAIFIIWDKIFGTYQAELVDVEPVYGVKRPVQTWNPIIINFQHLFLLMRDAWVTKSWTEKLTLWFKPTGYRPEDAAKKYPVYAIEDVYQYNKYETFKELELKIYAWFQVILHLYMMLYFFSQLNQFAVWEIIIYGVFLFASIFSFTSLLDRSRIALIAECVKLILIFSAVIIFDNWFLTHSFSGANLVFSVIFLLNIMFMLYVLLDKKYNLKIA